MATQIENDWLTTTEASELLKVARVTLEKYMKTGVLNRQTNQRVILESFKVGGKRMTTVRACDRFIEELNKKEKRFRIPKVVRSPLTTEETLQKHGVL